MENKKMKGDNGHVTSQNNDDKVSHDVTHQRSNHALRKPSSDGDDISIRDVQGKDDVDAGSSWSLFMPKDVRYHLQHPYFRLFIAYCVIFCNFFIYAEDPITHSFIECNIPLIGNDFAMFFTYYPSNAFSLLKIVMSLLGILAGIFLGYFIHQFLLNRLCRLRMFSDDKGSWMIMFLTSTITVFVMSLIYTGFLTAAGDYTIPYRISMFLGISNSRFTKFAAVGTWLGDVFTAWMVTDIMLQDRLYPQFVPRVRAWWQRGYNRIILFWVVVGVSTFTVVLVISTDWVQWDSINKNLFHTGELSRAFLASAILVMDFTIVAQDWDFPHFISNFDIKLPGFNFYKIDFHFLNRVRVHITGKWFNYGILFFVMLLDLNMWKNQIIYEPFDFGQYTGPDDRIYSPRDPFTVANSKNRTYFDYEWRNTTINPLTNATYHSADHRTNARYHHTKFAIKAIAFIPSLLMIAVFVFFIIKFGRDKPTDDNPYFGRLKKRRPKNRSMVGIELSRIDEGEDNLGVDQLDGPMIVGGDRSSNNGKAGERSSKVFIADGIPFCDDSLEDLYKASMVESSIDRKGNVFYVDDKDSDKKPQDVIQNSSRKQRNSKDDIDEAYNNIENIDQVDNKIEYDKITNIDEIGNKLENIEKSGNIDGNDNKIENDDKFEQKEIKNNDKNDVNPNLVSTIDDIPKAVKPDIEGRKSRGKSRSRTPSGGSKGQRSSSAGSKGSTGAGPEGSSVDRREGSVGSKGSAGQGRGSMGSKGSKGRGSATSSPHHSPPRFSNISPFHSPNQSPNRSPKRSPNRSPNHSLNQSPYSSPKHSPNPSPNHSPKQSSTTSPDHSPPHSPHTSPKGSTKGQRSRELNEGERSPDMGSVSEKLNEVNEGRESDNKESPAQISDVNTAEGQLDSPGQIGQGHTDKGLASQGHDKQGQTESPGLDVLVVNMNNETSEL